MSYVNAAHPLVPGLLEHWWVVILVPHLNTYSGARLHPSHAESIHHQRVRPPPLKTNTRSSCQEVGLINNIFSLI